PSWRRRPISPTACACTASTIRRGTAGSSPRRCDGGDGACARRDLRRVGRSDAAAGDRPVAAAAAARRRAGDRVPHERAGDEPPPARAQAQRYRRGRGAARRRAGARLSLAAAAVRAAARLAGRGRDVLGGAARVVQATRRGVGQGETAMTSTTDAVTVTTCVAVDPATAFTVFTEDIDRWWRRSPRYRFVDG